MSFPAPRRLLENEREATMSIPTVTEITRRPEAVAHDTFIDDLRRGLRSARSVQPAVAAPPQPGAGRL
jgi:hypothetical protein